MNPRTRIFALLTLSILASGATRIAQAAPTSESAEGGAKPLGKLTKPPRLIKFFQAPYPESERVKGSKASVALAIAIGADGKVADVSVVASGGIAFDEAAVAATKLFEFSPAEIDGIAAPVRIQYRYDFELKAAVPVAVPKTSDFGGVVRDRKTKGPLAGVTVLFDSETATTDPNGRFHFAGVSPGVHSITLSGSLMTSVGTEETLVAGHKYDATYEVDVATAETPPEERIDFEVIVVDTQLEKSVGSTSVNAEQGRQVAGTGGDVIKVVENLPGVARSTVGSGALVVWGAGAADTRVYVSDVHVPVLYHEGGFRSVVHSDLVKSVELEPGGYGSPHGRGLGGLVTVGLKPLAASEGYHGSVTVDAIDAAASASGQAGKVLHFDGAVRRSHLDWVLSQATSRDVGAFVPIPKYWDSQLRLAWAPRVGESAEVGTLLSSDRISRSLLEADPANAKTESKAIGFERVYFRYQRQLDDGGTVAVTPYFGFDHSRVSSQFGSVPAVLDNQSKVYGCRAAWNGQPADFLSLSAGIDTEAALNKLSRQGSITSPPREGDVRVFGQVPSDQVNADKWDTVNASLAPYVEGDFSLAKGRIHIIPGLRLEPAVVSASRVAPGRPDQAAIGTSRESTELEPRLAARWSLTKRLKARAAFGIYHQQPLPEDLSATFGNPALGPGRAVHYLAGASYQLSKPLSFELTSFYSRQTDLVTRSPLPTPALAQALVQGGLGRAYGTQVLLRHDLSDHFFGWLSYSLLRSERTDGGSRTYRPFDLDQTHVFTALGSYELGAGFEAGARFRYSTGYPRTPIVRAVFDSRTGFPQPIFGAHNSIRIPDFYQVDARIAKRIDTGGGTHLELYLDVQNVTNYGNPEEIVYNDDYSKKSYITGLPILPVLGAKLTW